MDNLEKFFREGAQNHGLEFNESDWLQLKGQLDKEMPIGFSLLGFLRRYGIGVIVLLLVTVGWFAFDFNPEEPTSDRTVSAEPNSSNVPVTGAATTKEKQDVNQATVSGKTAIGESVADNDVPSALPNAMAKDFKAKEGKNQFPIRNTGDELKDKGQVVLGEGVETDRHSSSKQLLFLFSIPPDFIIDAPSQNVESVEKHSEILPNQAKTSFFKLGIGYSPDFSTVGIGNFVAPGSRWTFVAEYGFLKRFVLSTGVVLVNNKYEAYGEDYHAPARYWRKGIVADEAYGECQMIDIPLNLRYNVIQAGKNSVFVNAGASTYFVTKEDYYFQYELDDPELPTHWGTDKTSIYPFGIINLSLGYERELSRRSGFQIEPFIKIPTTGIGWGNVDLHTMGIYFLYKYKL
jgi:hypothetical protein